MAFASKILFVYILEHDLKEDFKVIRNNYSWDICIIMLLYLYGLFIKALLCLCICVILYSSPCFSANTKRRVNILSIKLVKILNFYPASYKTRSQIFASTLETSVEFIFCMFKIKYEWISSNKVFLANECPELLHRHCNIKRRSLLEIKSQISF